MEREREEPPEELAEEEWRALETAVRRGYYEVPRRATLGDLASELSTTDVDVSRRLRRAVRKLFRADDE
jgi:predicted DNA binding protein